MIYNSMTWLTIVILIGVIGCLIYDVRNETWKK